jgi:hypothetical protein
MRLELLRLGIVIVLAHEFAYDSRVVYLDGESSCSVSMEDGTGPIDLSMLFVRIIYLDGTNSYL